MNAGTASDPGIEKGCDAIPKTLKGCSAKSPLWPLRSQDCEGLRDQIRSWNVVVEKKIGLKKNAE